jgi:CheY-like chemotaxis protein
MVLDLFQESATANHGDTVVESRISALERRLGVRLTGHGADDNSRSTRRPAQENSHLQKYTEHRTSRVLVVDDNKDAADILAELLNALGYDATTDYHPHAALDRVNVEEFDAFVLDIGLPELDGHALARELKTYGNCAGALFIALTGYNSIADRARSTAAGFDHHFSKPADLGSLVAALGPPRKK